MPCQGNNASKVKVRLAATERFHGDSGLEFGAVSAALANEWESPSQWRCPVSEVNNEICLEESDQLSCPREMGLIYYLPRSFIPR